MSRTLCIECGNRVEVTGRGRPRLYCSNACRMMAMRRRKAAEEQLALAEQLTKTPAGAPRAQLPAGAHPDDQVVAAIMEVRGISAALLRLGRETRPQFAWRCECLGKAINDALWEYFKEVLD